MNYKFLHLIFLFLIVVSNPACAKENNGGNGMIPDKPSEVTEVKNVIFMIGDGMGLAQLSYLEAENDWKPTAFSRAQHIALVSTYSANNKVTDSAASGTALSTGTKTNNGMLGQTPDGTKLPSIAERASKDGRPVGIVVSCYLQHATPAAFYAHQKSRSDYEKINGDLLNCGFDVLIGGGTAYMDLEEMKAKNYRTATTLAEASKIASGRLVLMSASKELPKAPVRGNYIPDATEKALEILAANSKMTGKGFFLMIEGSHIDWACEANNREYLLAEMQDFEKTVKVAMDYADKNPGTLVVVTADHETGGLYLRKGASADAVDATFGVRDAHTGVRVPAYFYGTGATEFACLLDNTGLSKKIAEMMRLP